MKKSKLQELSLDQLKQKEKSLKMFIGIFIPLIMGLFSFIIMDYFNGEEMDLAILTIAICTLGGPVTIYPELKEVLKEIKARS